jgi:hypothetical protein
MMYQLANRKMSYRCHGRHPPFNRMESIATGRSSGASRNRVSAKTGFQHSLRIRNSLDDINASDPFADYSAAMVE